MATSGTVVSFIAALAALTILIGLVVVGVKSFKSPTEQSYTVSQCNVLSSSIAAYYNTHTLNLSADVDSKICDWCKYCKPMLDANADSSEQVPTGVLSLSDPEITTTRGTMKLSGVCTTEYVGSQCG